MSPGRLFFGQMCVIYIGIRKKSQHHNERGGPGQTRDDATPQHSSNFSRSDPVTHPPTRRWGVCFPPLLLLTLSLSSFTPPPRSTIKIRIAFLSAAHTLPMTCTDNVLLVTTSAVTQVSECFRRWGYRGTSAAYVVRP